MKRMKQVFKTWNNEVFGRVELVTKELEQRIEVLEANLQEGYEVELEHELLVSKLELASWQKR